MKRSIRTWRAFEHSKGTARVVTSMGFRQHSSAMFSLQIRNTWEWACQGKGVALLHQAVPWPWRPTLPVFVWNWDLSSLWFLGIYFSCDTRGYGCPVVCVIKAIRFCWVASWDSYAPRTLGETGWAPSWYKTNRTNSKVTILQTSENWSLLCDSVTWDYRNQSVAIFKPPYLIYHWGKSLLPCGTQWDAVTWPWVSVSCQNTEEMLHETLRSFPDG